MNDELRERARVMKRELSRKAVEWTRHKDFECVTSLNDLDEFTQALAAFAEECIKDERKRIAELEHKLASAERLVAPCTRFEIYLDGLPHYLYKEHDGKWYDPDLKQYFDTALEAFEALESRVRY